MVGGQQQLSVVGGEVQDSEAHARREIGPAVDLPGDEGQEVRYLFPPASLFWGYDQFNGHYVLFEAVIDGVRITARYSHLQAAGALRVGSTGQATGPHIHLVLWVDGVRVRPEAYAGFRELCLANG